jgi:hypothetical protein
MKASRPANRLPRAEADPKAEPDPLQLSRLVLALHGVLVLARVRNTPALPLDLVGVDAGGWPVLAAVLSDATPADRLDLLVRLLGNAELGEMVRRGCRLLAMAWSRDAHDGHVAETVSLTAADYPAEGAG